MLLSEIRAQFVELAGRDDLALVPATGVGVLNFKKRADFFIQAASKWLDDNVDIDRKVAHYSYDMTVGTYKLLVPDNKVISRVYAQYSNDNIIELQEKSYAWIRDNYKRKLSQLSNSKPAYWCKGVAELGPTQLALTSATYTGSYTYEFGDTIFAGDTIPGTVGRYRATSLLILPPVDQTFTISVVGEFYAKVLFEDGDINLWSDRHPELLLKASLRELEGFYRNTEGRKDWEDFLFTDKQGIEFNKAEQESHGINQMEG